MNAATRKVVNVGYGLALALLAANALLAYLDIRAIVRGNWWVEHTREVVAQLERAASTLKDAETGQRGYLLTGKDEYLKPYVDASNGLDKELDRLFALTADNPEQQARLAELRRIAGEKIAELGRTVALMRKGDRDAALAVVQTDRGQRLMDRARALLAEMRAEEDRLLPHARRRPPTPPGGPWPPWSSPRPSSPRPCCWSPTSSVVRTPRRGVPPRPCGRARSGWSG